MQASVTFIVPTVEGRESVRERAIKSVLAQTDPDWFVVVCGDGFMPETAYDARVFVGHTAKRSGAAATRNVAMANLHLARATIDTEWFAFLDDDDTVSEQYVEDLKRVSDADVVVFRMFHRQLGVLPDPVEPQLVHGRVGISFAVRREFAWQWALEFDPSEVNEDIEFLRECGRSGARIHLHPKTHYFVRDERP